MSFYCNFCKQLTANNQSPVKAVVSSRPKTYHNVVNKKTIESQGWEIQKEVNICKECNNKEVNNG